MGTSLGPLWWVHLPGGRGYGVSCAITRRWQLPVVESKVEWCQADCIPTALPITKGCVDPNIWPSHSAPNSCFMWRDTLHSWWGDKRWETHQYGVFLHHCQKPVGLCRRHECGEGRPLCCSTQQQHSWLVAMLWMKAKCPFSRWQNSCCCNSSNGLNVSCMMCFNVHVYMLSKLKLYYKMWCV